MHMTFFIQNDLLNTWEKFVECIAEHPVCIHAYAEESRGMHIGRTFST